MENPFNKTLNYKFPNAIETDKVLDKAFEELENHGYSPENVVPSVMSCRDDTVGDMIKKLPQKGFMPNFSMRTLSGYPIIGMTGIGAYYHHLHKNDDRNEPGVIIYSPHIGIDCDCNTGYVDRCGQEHSSPSCGANHKILSYWNSGNEIPSQDEPELLTVESQLRHVKEDILNSSSPLENLTTTEYELGKEKLESMIKKLQNQEPENHPILLISGIHIDTPSKSGQSTPNYFLIKEILWIHEGEGYNPEVNY